MWGLRKGRRELITSLLPGVLVTCNQAGRSRAGSAPICTHSAWCCLPRHHPQGAGTKVAVVICRDGARRTGTLLSASALPSPCAGSAPRCRGLPLWDTLREAAQQTPSWVFTASRHCLNSHIPHHKSLQALACLQNPGETEKGALRLGPADASPCRGAERRVARPGPHLPLPVDDPLI